MIEPRPALAAASNAPVSQALRQASAQTGAGFGYLVKTAMRESSLNPQAKSSSSSASGLFQFIDQTWLGVMKRHGAEHGLGQYADAIQTDSHGRQHVPDPKMKEEILALKQDPKVACLMAGELTEENRQVLQTRLGRSVSDGELYAAHFMGADAASDLIGQAQKNPGAQACDLFPGAARANRSIFYGHDGQPRTVAEVYDRLTRDHGGNGASTRFAVADARPVRAAKPASADALPVHLASMEYDSTANTGGMAVPASSSHGLPSKQPLILSPSVISVLAALNPIPDGLRPARASGDHTLDRTA